MMTAQKYEDDAWKALDKGNKAESILLFQQGIKVSQSKARAERYSIYIEDIQRGAIQHSSHARGNHTP